ncbi:hypothetical protein [Paenirhodobacter sp. CAU 1674]|jgi:hypothetical protein|uniref:hypothetical protein n=1 Tax=Paenirhodobacter sp. CAU 1674 TaxID=3032596 RepID=UPI0023DACB7F|nr:hypothetical protein [Paenirhodobacter sp. CAU 1674]MDF2142789.1 hypothetical protein [Paenirhodobacter sp. CAU 1674]
MSVLARLWREQRGVLIAFVLALGLALFFGGRMVSRALYWADPAHRQQAPEPWMSPGYIARSWHLRIEDIDAVLGVTDGRALVGKGPPTLERIAAALGVPVVDLIERLNAALPALAAQAPPGP